MSGKTEVLGCDDQGPSHSKGTGLGGNGRATGIMCRLRALTSGTIQQNTMRRLSR